MQALAYLKVTLTSRQPPVDACARTRFVQDIAAYVAVVSDGSVSEDNLRAALIHETMPAFLVALDSLLRSLLAADGVTPLTGQAAYDNLAATYSALNTVATAVVKLLRICLLAGGGSSGSLGVAALGGLTAVSRDLKPDLK
jgi:hypothetical protein